MVQSVLIFGAETWVVTHHVGRVLGGVPGPSWVTIGSASPAAVGRREVGVHLGGDGKGEDEF